MARKNPLYPIDKMRVGSDENTRLVSANALHDGFGRAIGLRHGKLREAFNRFFVLGLAGIKTVAWVGVLSGVGVVAALAADLLLLPALASLVFRARRSS